MLYKKHFLFPVKISFGIAAALLAVFSLSACGQSEVSVSSQASSTPELQGGEAAAYGDVQNLKMLSQSADNIGYQACTENGMYRVVIEDGHAKIRYWDQATNQSAYLCAIPNCQHNTDACTAYIAKGGTAPKIISNGVNIFLIYPGYNGGDDSYSPFIEMADLDGSNRHTLYTFESNQEFGEGIVGNENILFFILNSVSSNGRIFSESLVALDTQTEELTEVQTFKKDSLFLLGSSQSSLILKFWNDDDLFEVFSYDVSSGESQQIETYDIDKNYNIIVEDWVFDLVFDGENISLVGKNLATGDCIEIPYCMISISGSAGITPLGYYQGTLYVSSPVSIIYSGNEILNHKIAEYAIDTENKSVSQISFSDPVTGHPLSIIGAVGNSEDTLVIEKNEYSGTTQESFVKQSYWSISTQDFLQGVDSFVSIG